MKLTSPLDVIRKDDEFRAIVEKVEEALKNPRIEEPYDGWGSRVEVNVDVDERFEAPLTAIYEALGWRLAFKYIGRVFFILPDDYTLSAAKASITDEED